MLVFIVEDSDMYAMMLEHKLGKTNHVLFKKFVTGEECIKFMYMNPGLIILDYNLPGIDGLETLKSIKKINYDIPVVILSGQQDLKIAIKMFGAGAFEYITKDNDTLNELKKTIDRISMPRIMK